MNELSLAIFIVVFIIVMEILTIIAKRMDKKVIGDIHVYSNGDGNPPTWNFTLKKDLDINNVSDLRYAVFRVIKEDV